MKVYRSSLDVPDLQPFFPHAKPLAHVNCAQHTVLGDPEIFESCGYITHDEAVLLYQIAKNNTGLWLEIGSHTGWSTAHLAKAGNTVIALDPEFSAPHYNKTINADLFRQRFIENVGGVIGTENVLPFVRGLDLSKPTVNPKVYMVGAASWDCLPALAATMPGQFKGVFVDGEHHPPLPMVDAMLVAPLLSSKDSVAVFHDAIGAPVVAAVLWLRDYMAKLNPSTRLQRYFTPQCLSCVAVGGIMFPDHTPDPDFDWAAHYRYQDRAASAALVERYERWRLYSLGFTRMPFDSL